MPFLGKGTKHRRYGQTGPYGPGAGFAIGSGERLAARRRETAQAKAFVRRYPGMRPQAMDTVAGAMFGNGQSAGLMTGFGDVRRGAGFAQFEESGWEDPTATTPYPVSRNQFQSPSAFAPSRGPAFGRQRQSFWPGREFREAILRSQGMRQPIREEDFLEELYSWRQPEDDYLDAYGGLGTRQFPRQFDDYQRALRRSTLSLLWSGKRKCPFQRRSQRSARSRRPFRCLWRTALFVERQSTR
jgi:hypothetical protein